MGDGFDDCGASAGPGIHRVKNPLSWKQVVANVLALLSGSAFARALSAIILIVIARQIGPEAYGQYSASIAFVGLTTVLFSLGLDGWLLYQGGRDPEQLDVWFTSALSLKLLLGMVWLVGLWLVAPYLNQSSYPWLLIVLASLALWLEELALIIWSAFKASLRNDITLILMILSQGLYLGAVIWLAVRQAQDPESYMVGRFLAALLATAVSGFLIARKLALRVRWQALRTTFRGTLPFAASVALTAIYGRADLAIIGNALGKEAAGVYAPALTLTNALFLIPAAIYGVMVPILSQGFATDRSWVQQTARRLSLLMTLAGVGLGLGLALAAHPIITLLYGSAFQASGDVLALLSGVLVLRCPTTALAATIVATGWQVPRLGIQAIAAVLNVTLNLLVVHQAGVMGVAKVYLLTEVVLLLGHLGLFLLWMRKENRRAGE
jgi:O-antigen/teichoic acid export membrane protein